MIAIGFCVAALMLASGFIEWIFWATRESAIHNGLGHVHVSRTGYTDGGSANPIGFLVPDERSVLAALESTAGVKVVAPRLQFGGLIAHEDTTLSFVADAIDPTKERRVSSALEFTAGEPPDDRDPTGIALGQGLASALGVTVGTDVVLLGTTASGSTNAVDAHVRGIFTTQVIAYDDVAVRLPITLARKLMKVSGSNLLVVVLDETERTPSIVADWRSRFSARGLEIIPWYEISDFYAKTVALLSRQMSFMRSIIALVIVLGVANVLAMNVFERTGEIGTVLALGDNRGRVLGTFFVEAIVLGAFGALAGVAAGLLLAWTISYFGIPMPPPPGRSAGYFARIIVTWQASIGAFGLALVSTVVAGSYPAWKASRLPIVDALRHNR